jgi:hypothetical protein
MTIGLLTIVLDTVKERVALRISDHSSNEEIKTRAHRNSHQFVLRLLKFTTTVFTHFCRLRRCLGII